MRYHPLAVLIALTLVACQQAPSQPTGVTRAAAPTPHLSAGLQAKAEGDAEMRRGDYRAAVDRYRRAAALEPDDMTIRFALGTAQTFVGDRQGAVDHFRQVVKRGDPASAEHREAQRWLSAAGIAPEPGVARPTESSARSTNDAARAAEKIVGGRLVGRMEWPGVDPRKRAVRGELWLYGAEGANETVKRSRPISLGGSYHFYDIPPGQYRIVARLFSTPSDVTVWDQKVMVEDGRPTELVLTPETARVSPDKFPPPPAG
jgi:TPR repeat